MFGPQTVVAHREALTKAKGKFTMAGSRSSVSWIYFIQAGQDGPIKIGVAGEPQTRLRIIQSGHYDELRLLCAVFCAGHGDWIEQRLHAELQEHRLRGEWFKPSPAVFAVIAKTIAGEAFIRGMDGALLRSSDNAPLYLEPIPRMTKEMFAMANLNLPVNGTYFDQILSGEKTEEYRLVTPYWKKRIAGRVFDWVILTRGYPKDGGINGVTRIARRWQGYSYKTITHPHFGHEPVQVFAIDVSRPAAEITRLSIGGDL